MAKPEWLAAMKKVNYLIIGGGIAGTTAAETIRQHDKTGSIAIVSDEPYPLYSRVMLSKADLFLGKIPIEKVFLKHDLWYKENTIELIAGRNAVRLDTAKKIVTLSDGAELNYEKLLLAIGSCSRKLDIPGAATDGVFVLRTIADAKALMKKTKKAKRALAIGGGFTNFEMCNLFRKLGIETTLVIRKPHFWDPVLDKPSAEIIEKALEKGGVKIIKNAEVKEIIGGHLVESAVLKDGTKLPCEIIIFGVGTFCPFEWLKQTGIETNRGIVANEHLKTNQPDIWAAGDAAEFYHPIFEDKLQFGGWTDAQLQGKTAALNMLGKKETFKWVPFYTTSSFGISITFAGDIRPLPDRIIIPRGAGNSNSRIIIKGNRIVGATLINRNQELQPILKLIENKTDISQKQKELADPNSELKTL